MKNELQNIKEVSLIEIKHLINNAKKENISFTPTKNETKYIGYFVKNIVIGFVGYEIQTAGVRFKSDYIHPNYRGNGYYQELFNYRMDIFRNEKKISAYCTIKSLSTYLKNGFEIVSTNKKRITYVIRTNEKLQRMDTGAKI